MSKFLTNMEKTIFPELKTLGIEPKTLYSGDKFERNQAFAMIDILQSNTFLGNYPQITPEFFKKLTNLLGQLFSADYFNNPEVNKFMNTLPLTHFMQFITTA